MISHVRTERGRAYWLIGACVALFAGFALFGQVQFQGSVPAGVASPTPLSLTLRGAIRRGLRTNPGLLVSGQRAWSVAYLGNDSSFRGNRNHVTSAWAVRSYKTGSLQTVLITKKGRL